MQSRNSSNSKGIDISHYQDVTSWQSVKDSGVTFAFLKASEGASMGDDSFASHMAGAKSVGIKVGAYHFLRATSVDNAIAEADHFISVVNDNGGFGIFDLAPVVDLETRENPAEAPQIIMAWIDRVKEVSGMQPILYSYPSFADAYLNNASLTDIPLWLANYGTWTPSNRAVWSTWTFLQYTDQGRVNGISGNVDMNEFNGDISNYSPYVVKAVVQENIVSPIQEDEDNMTMKLTEDQWQRLNGVYGQRYNNGEFTDWNWMVKIRNRTMTATELAFLASLLTAKKDGLSIEPEPYGM